MFQVSARQSGARRFFLYCLAAFAAALLLIRPCHGGGDFIAESPDCVNDYVKSPETRFILAGMPGRLC